MPEGMSARKLASVLGLTNWQIRLAQEQGLLARPDLPAGRWSAALIKKHEPQAEQIRATLGEEPPAGAIQAAARLAGRLTLDVDKADIETLVVSGELSIASRYQGYPVYTPRDLDALNSTTVTKVVAARKGPLFDSINGRAAAIMLGWPRAAFDQIAAERALPTDQLKRYVLADVQQLANDQDLRRVVNEEQRKAALRAALRGEDRAEADVRLWLQHCANYLARTDDELPNPSEIRRALKALAAARAETQLHNTP